MSIAAKFGARYHGLNRHARSASTFLAAVLIIAGSGVASAYVGDSFVNIPGRGGNWHSPPFKHWIRIEDNYWETGLDRRLLKRNFDSADRLTFSGPGAPHPGVPSSLTISVNKHNPDFSQLMDLCLKRT